MDSLPQNHAEIYSLYRILELSDAIPYRLECVAPNPASYFRVRLEGRIYVVFTKEYYKLPVIGAGLQDWENKFLEIMGPPDKIDKAPPQYCDWYLWYNLDEKTYTKNYSEFSVNCLPGAPLPASWRSPVTWH